ncbi:hypothetical protein [Crassaminicella profunda]|nr:hypothetical protein [Crassaminicella profunda]
MEKMKVQMEEHQVENTEQKEMAKENEVNVNYFGCGRFSDEYAF